MFGRDVLEHHHGGGLEGRLRLRLQEASDATSLSLRQIRRAIADGSLKSTKIGRRRIILAEGLLVWLMGGKFPPMS